mgnify:CR=1 FL=1
MKYEQLNPPPRPFNITIFLWKKYWFELKNKTFKFIFRRIINLLILLGFIFSLVVTWQLPIVKLWYYILVRAVSFHSTLSPGPWQGCFLSRKKIDERFQSNALFSFSKKKWQTSLQNKYSSEAHIDRIVDYFVKWVCTQYPSFVSKVLSQTHSCAVQQDNATVSEPLQLQRLKVSV